MRRIYSYSPSLKGLKDWVTSFGMESSAFPWYLTVYQAVSVFLPHIGATQVHNPMPLSHSWVLRLVI